MDTENNTLQAFFIELAQYFRNENDLSDVTVALCNANPKFKEIFLKFFFEDNIDVNNVISIEREVTKGDSRVDIYIKVKNDEVPFLIEVKIYDQNHHLGQYERAFGIERPRLGYITNYPLSKDGYNIKTWREFKDYLKNSEYGNDHTIIGYIKYLEHVCNIDIHNDPISLDNAFDEALFAYMVRSIIEYNSNKIYLTKYHTKYLNRPYYGIFYGRTFIDTNKGGYLILGVKPGQASAIVLAVHARSHQEQFALDNLKSNGNYYTAPKNEKLVAESNVCFYLKDDRLKQFMSAKSFKEQENILRNFLDEVITQMLPPIPFTHLHVHSVHSLCHSAVKVEDAVDEAIRLGMKALAITDYDSIYAAHELAKYAHSVAEDFKTIVGCEMHVAPVLDLGKKSPLQKAPHLTVLCKNATGYQNLCKLLELAWNEGFLVCPTVKLEWLAEHKDGLIVLSGCPGGEVAKHFFAGDIKDAEDVISLYHHVFQDDYYLELVRNGSDDKLENDYTRFLLDIGKK